MKLEYITLLNSALGNGVGLWILLVISVLSVSIDGSLVLTTLIKEVEFEDTKVGCDTCLTSYEPVVSTFRLTSNGNVACRLGLKITAVIPVNGYILNELEGIIILLIVLWRSQPSE